VEEVEPICCKSLWDLVKETGSSWDKINAPRLGAALAFYTLLSVAPLIVVCIAIAGMIFGHEAATGQIRYQIQNMVGNEGGKVLESLLENAYKPAQGITAAAVGFFMLLFGASGVFGEAPPTVPPASSPWSSTASFRSRWCWASAFCCWCRSS
jgi:membrane protein